MGWFSSKSEARIEQETADRGKVARSLRSASSRGEGDRIARKAGYRDAEQALEATGGKAGWRNR